MATAATVALVTLAACGGSTSNSSATTETTVNGATGHRPVPDALRGRTAAQLEPLRPPSVTSILAGLDRDPEDPELYARGAIAYADTDYSGMTLVYGQTYRILATHGPKTVDTSNAMARVLRERVVAASDPTDVVFNLAPGEMPMLRTSDGGQMAPFVFLFEHSMGRTSGLGSTSRTEFEGAAAVFAAELTVICRNNEPVLPEEFYVTLCGIARAGHRDTYAHWVIGPAFASAWEAYAASHTQAVNAFQTYLAAHPYRPRTATRADDLFPVRGAAD